MRTSIISILLFQLICVDKTFAQGDSTKQVQPNKFEFHLSAGACIPLEKFADLEDEDGDDNRLRYSTGAAKTGINIKLGMDYYFGQYSGLTTMFCLTGNKGVSIDSADFFYQPYISAQDFNYTYDPGTWKSLGLFAGYTMRKQVGKFQANVSLMAGVMQMTIPTMTLEYSFINDNNGWSGYDFFEHTWTQHSDKSTALAGDVALKLQYRIGKKLSVLFNMDYMFSKFTFNVTAEENKVTTYYLTDDLSEYYKHQWDPWSGSFNFKKNVSLLGLNAGISYLIF